MRRATVVLLSNSRTTDSRGAAKSAELLLRCKPRLAACALLSNSRTTDSRGAAKSAELLLRCKPRLAACALYTVSLAAQDSQFDVQSRLVLVPVTVTDARGRFIDGLESPDFKVLDNGRVQKAAVDAFATGVAPIALVVAVQTSGISAVTLEKVRKTGAMIQPLITGERGCAALVSFAEQVRWPQDCTSDPDALVRAFEKLRPGEEKRGRMLDAVQEAIDRLRRRSNVRRVVLLISESRDRGSATDLESVVTAAQDAGVSIYAATYSAFKTAFTSKSSATGTPRPATRPSRPSEEAGTITGGPPSTVNPPIAPPAQRVDILGGLGELKRLRKEKATEVLADATGGTTFPFTRQRALEDAIERLGAELHSQYVLSFAPEDPAPGYHHLEVRINRRGEFRIRARPGYWATAQAR